MKKTISKTDLDTLLRLAEDAGKKAAQEAVGAGRIVTSLENGQVVKYSPGNPIPPSNSSDQSDSTAG